MATIVERLRDSQNAHDAEGMAALFADDYDSQQPVHPSRAFGGRAQVLQNWTSVFQGVPDFVSDLVSFTAAGDTEWGEWYWHGHHVDGSTQREGSQWDTARARKVRCPQPDP